MLRRRRQRIESPDGNFTLANHPGLLIKECHWRWPERNRAGNTVDFFMRVLGEPFHDAMRHIRICGTPQPLLGPAMPSAGEPMNEESGSSGQPPAKSEISNQESEIPGTVPDQPAPSPGSSLLPAVITPEAQATPPAALNSPAVPSIGVLGKVDNLSEMEQIEYQACEAVLMMSSRTFVDAGQALGRIRDLRLYREEFNTFEDYCRAKWEYGRIYAHQLIAAAHLVTHLFANCKHRRPDRESQLRPLTGLPLDQAQLVWEKAAEHAGGRKITASRVRAAMIELQFAPPTQPASKITRQKRAEQRRKLDEAIGQLLVLISQKATHDLLAKQVEALHGHIQALFPAPAKPQSR